MPSYSLTHLADHVLLRDLHALVARDRATTAELLAHIAEVDTRKLYLPAAYPSLHAYCVGELRMSGDSASKRIQAARVAREFPAILPAVADGRLHLSAVVLLAPHLCRETADELMAAAANRTKAEIEVLLAERFPRADVPTRLEAIPPRAALGEHAPGHVALLAGPPAEPSASEHAPGHVEASASRTRIAPLSPGRYALQATITQEMHDDLRYAQALLAHAVPSGDPTPVLARALKELVNRLEQRRFAPGARSRPGRPRSSRNPRHIPADVRRAVWLRDGGQCAFVSASGKRCPARSMLEFDHLEPVARVRHTAHSGAPTAERVRLCCRAHNQYAAELAFGGAFMQGKREQARRRAVEARLRGAAGEIPPQMSLDAAPDRTAVTVATLRQLEPWGRRRHVDQDSDQSVVPWLRALGCRADEARRGAQLCEQYIPDATMEDKVKFATSRLTQGLARKVSFSAPAPA